MNNFGSGSTIESTIINEIIKAIQLKHITSYHIYTNNSGIKTFSIDGVILSNKNTNIITTESESLDECI